MLENEENIPNKEHQSEVVLKHENAPKKESDFPYWKRPVLLAVGYAGFVLLTLIVSFMCLGIPQSDQDGAITLISYSLLFVCLIGIVFTDIPKVKKQFTKIKPYAFGILFGIGILLFDFGYSSFVNLFYQSEVGGNETGIRSVIDIFPIASVFIFGIIGPMCEELTYRVGLYGLVKRFNKYLAYAVTGIIFGLLHFDWSAADLVNEAIILPSYVFSGIAFSVAYELFGLPCSWTAHAFNNLFVVIGHIIVTRI